MDLNLTQKSKKFIMNKKLLAALYFIGSITLALLFAPKDFIYIAIFVLISLIISILLYFLICKKFNKDFYEKVSTYELIISALFLFSVATIFIKRWRDSDKVASLSSKIHTSSFILVLIISIILFLLTFYFITRILVIIKNIFSLLHAKMKESSYKQLKVFVYSFFILSLFFVEIQYTTISFAYGLGLVGIINFILNIGMIAILLIVLQLIIRRWRISLLIISILGLCFSVVNFYVVKFHGSPLFISEFKNFNTALNVLGGYVFSFDIELLIIASLFALQLMLILRLSKEKQIFSWIKCAIAAGYIVVYALVIYLFIFPRIIISWSIDESVAQNGFFLCAVDDLSRMSNSVNQPDGYDENKLSKIPKSTSVLPDTALPDIIFILNESFCDLSKYTTVTTDKDYLSDYYSLDNTQFGNSIVPMIGYGTNNSEFELLTSQSSYLLNLPSPFNYLDFSNNGGIVQYLNSLGYISTAMHSQTSRNYSRQSAYPQLGFKNSLFIENFNYTLNHNGNREYLDADNYADLISLYDENSTKPQFFYLLTFQNHGGYDQNDDSLDTVHAVNGAGSIESELNEYLSSVSLSSSAFKDLTSYFEKVSRPVIICMVGDHAPPFIGSLTLKNDINDIDREVAQKTVPYAIWSNCGIDFSSVPSTLSLTTLVPNILNKLELPLSTFYQTVLDLQNKLPILLSSGRYIDSNGNVGEYNKNSDYYDDLSLYYQMEYNALKGNNYCDNLFSIENCLCNYEPFN